jgi:hypothetical protein
MSDYDVEEDYNGSRGHAAADVLYKKYGSRAFKPREKYSAMADPKKIMMEKDPQKIAERKREMMDRLHKLREESLHRH